MIILQSYTSVLIATGFFISLVFTIGLGEIIFKAELKSEHKPKELNKNCPLIKFLDETEDVEILPELFCLLHKDPTYRSNVNIVADFIYITENMYIAKALFKLELEFHKSDKHEVYKCVKKNMGTTKQAAIFLGLAKVPKTLFEKAKSQLLDNPKIERINKFWQKNCAFVPPKNLLLSFKQVIFFFVDLAKDIILIVIISRLGFFIEIFLLNQVVSFTTLNNGQQDFL